MVVNGLANANAAPINQPIEPRRNIDPIPMDVIIMKDNVPIFIPIRKQP
jgi:hypothetical protein